MADPGIAKAPPTDPFEGTGQPLSCHFFAGTPAHGWGDEMRVFMHLGLLLAAFSPTCSAVAVAQDSPASLFGGDAIAPPPSGLNVWRARSPDRTPVVIFLEDMDGLGTRRCQIGELGQRH